MKNSVKLLAILLIFLSIPSSIFAQGFGKNKVQYGDFDWVYFETPHFTIYFYQGGEYIAEFAADVLEKALIKMQNDLDYQIKNKIPVILYKSHNDFQQTNIISEYPEEGVGGFTELFKNRVALPFEGSYEQYRHVLHHEMVHAFFNDMFYGGSMQSVLTSAVQFQQPLWFAEGLAEYFSMGWDTRTDMVLRDGSINDYLTTTMSPYPQGQSIFHYIEEKYGKPKVSDFIRRVNINKDIDKGFRSSLGIDFEKFVEQWELAMKRKYWPDISDRQYPGEFATRLTDHEKTKNYMNVGATISPNGDKIAFITDKNGYMDVYLMSAVDGKIIDKILSGQRDPVLEELHFLTPGLSWSPDGKRIAISVKAGEQDALTIIDTKTKKYKSYKFGLDGIFDADWSPDGNEILFQGTKNGAADIYGYNLETEKLRKVTNDYFSNSSPSWSPDGSKILFISDRKDYVDEIINGDTELLMQNHDFRSTDIYVMNSDGSHIERLTFDSHNEGFPVWAPDGEKIAYASEANGISNIYILDLETRESYPITNALTGCYQLSWSKEGSKLVFSSFFKGGWDIYMIKNPLNKDSKANQLKNTVFFDQLIAEENEIQEKQRVMVAEKLANEARSKVKPPDLTQYNFSNLDRRQFEKGEKESEIFDVDPSKYKTEDGKYKINKYKLKFSPDIVYGNYAYDTFFGLQGSSIFLFSDMLGDHIIMLSTDLYFDLRNSNYQLFYLNLAQRTNYGIGIYNQANFFSQYVSTGRYTEIITIRLRNSGIDFMASRPFNKFSRIDFGLSVQQTSQEFLHPEYSIFDQTFTSYRSSLFLVKDTALWGMLGPVDGLRSNLMLTYSPPIGDKDKRFSFLTAMGDYRKYVRLRRDVTLALRLTGGMSEGERPEAFFLGGIPNWINRKFKGGLRTDLENVFYSYWITPLHGSNYYELIGNRFALLNSELRFPFIQAILMGWPAPLLLRDVRGALFWDIGAAWVDDNFKPTETNIYGVETFKDIRTGYGAGLNIYFAGMFLLRFDVAWNHNMQRSSKPIFYISFGGDW